MADKTLPPSSALSQSSPLAPTDPVGPIDPLDEEEEEEEEEEEPAFFTVPASDLPPRGGPSLTRRVSLRLRGKQPSHRLLRRPSIAASRTAKPSSTATPVSVFLKAGSPSAIAASLSASLSLSPSPSLPSRTPSYQQDSGEEAVEVVLVNKKEKGIPKKEDQSDEKLWELSHTQPATLYPFSSLKGAKGTTSLPLTVTAFLAKHRLEALRPVLDKTTSLPELLVQTEESLTSIVSGHASVSAATQLRFLAALRNLRRQVGLQRKPGTEKVPVLRTLQRNEHSEAQRGPAGDQEQKQVEPSTQKQGGGDGSKEGGAQAQASVAQGEEDEKRVPLENGDMVKQQGAKSGEKSQETAHKSAKTAATPQSSAKKKEQKQGQKQAQPPKQGKGARKRKRRSKKGKGKQSATPGEENESPAKQKKPGNQKQKKQEKGPKNEKSNETQMKRGKQPEPERENPDSEADSTAEEPESPADAKPAEKTPVAKKKKSTGKGRRWLSEEEVKKQAKAGVDPLMSLLCGDGDDGRDDKGRPVLRSTKTTKNAKRGKSQEKSAEESGGDEKKEKKDTKEDADTDADPKTPATKKKKQKSTGKDDPPSTGRSSGYVPPHLRRKLAKEETVTMWDAPPPDLSGVPQVIKAGDDDEVILMEGVDLTSAELDALLAQHLREADDGRSDLEEEAEEVKADDVAASAEPQDDVLFHPLPEVPEPRRLQRHHQVLMTTAEKAKTAQMYQFNAKLLSMMHDVKGVCEEISSTHTRIAGELDYARTRFMASAKRRTEAWNEELQSAIEERERRFRASQKKHDEFANEVLSVKKRFKRIVRYENWAKKERLAWLRAEESRLTMLRAQLCLEPRIKLEVQQSRELIPGILENMGELKSTAPNAPQLSVQRIFWNKLLIKVATEKPIMKIEMSVRPVMGTHRIQPHELDVVESVVDSISPYFVTVPGLRRDQDYNLTARVSNSYGTSMPSDILRGRTKAEPRLQFAETANRCGPCVRLRRPTVGILAAERGWTCASMDLCIPPDCNKVVWAFRILHAPFDFQFGLIPATADAVPQPRNWAAPIGLRDSPGLAWHAFRPNLLQLYKETEVRNVRKSSLAVKHLQERWVQGITVVVSVKPPLGVATAAVEGEDTELRFTGLGGHWIPAVAADGLFVVQLLDVKYED